MADTPYPLPRESRQSEILVGNGSAGPYGPSSFKIFDVVDVEVYQKRQGEAEFSRVTGAVVTKTSGLPYDTFSIRFPEPVSPSTKFIYASRRIHARDVSVFKAGNLVSDQFEKELSKQGSVLEELRRDVNRGGSVVPGTPGQALVFGSDGLPRPGINVEAADQALQAQIDAVKSLVAQGGAIEVPVFDSALAASFAYVKESIQTFRTGGFLAPGDGGGALYKKVPAEPGHPGNIQTADGAWWEIAESTITPLMIGAVRNTALDQTGALQNWLDILRATGADGYVPAGNYRLDGALSTEQSGLNVVCHRKVRFDARNAPAGTFSLTVSGTIGNYANVTVGQAQRGATRIRTTSSFALTLAVGDVVKIKSDDIFDASNTNMQYGELNVVTGLLDAAAGFVDLELPLSATYSTSPQIAKVTPVSDVEWIGGKFDGAIAEQNNQKAIRLRYARDFVLEAVQGERMDDRFFWIQDSMKGEIARPILKDSRPSSTGYGVSVIDACQDITIHHGSFSRIRHSFSTNNQSDNGGIPRRITFADNNVSGGAWARAGSMGPGDAIDTHGAAEDISIERNVVKGSPGAGINFECCSGVIRDNVIINTGGHGISIHNESDQPGSIVCTGNRIAQAGDNGIYLAPATRGSSSTYQSAVIANNVIDGAVDYGIQAGFTAGANFRGLVLQGNTVRNASATLPSIFLVNARQPVISGNHIDGNGTASGVVRLMNCVGFTVTGNSVTNPTGSAGSLISVDSDVSGGSTQGIISGNRCSVYSGSALAGPGVQLSNNVTQTAVIGNNLRGTGGVNIGTGLGNVQANNIV